MIIGFKPGCGHWKVTGRRRGRRKLARITGRVAGDRTSREEDYAAGQAPILYLQPDHDPLAHAQDAHEFKRALGDRVTIMVVRNCSHAAVTEEPDAISDALIDYALALWPKS